MPTEYITQYLEMPSHMQNSRDVVVVRVSSDNIGILAQYVRTLYLCMPSCEEKKEKSQRKENTNNVVKCLASADKRVGRSAPALEPYTMFAASQLDNILALLCRDEK